MFKHRPIKRLRKDEDCWNEIPPSELGNLGFWIKGEIKQAREKALIITPAFSYSNNLSFNFFFYNASYIS